MDGGRLYRLGRIGASPLISDIPNDKNHFFSLAAACKTILLVFAFLITYVCGATSTVVDFSKSVSKVHVVDGTDKQEKVGDLSSAKAMNTNKKR